MTATHQFAPRLRAAAADLGLDISPSQEHVLLTYLEQLQRWNRSYNLTAVRDPEQMLVQHLFDSLSIIPSIQKVLYKNTVYPVVVDVGSGAGLPGVVLAAMCPEATIHCVDTVEKKATFIRYVAGVLRLPNLQAHHARVEQLPLFEADLVVSRAFASLADFATLAGRHVSENGQLLAMKGREPTEEIEELSSKTSWRVARIEPLQVPDLDAHRCLVWLTEQGIA
ncbi:MAG: 16S rRNA (guanine(527)-N(7))-methyltransferase RsmG [Alcaligenaceae bacterium]|nr:16S rRNA (guanine(527)-N(7))-methyltransferase RsmG [Alcaligenaceae bacterium]